MHSEQSAFHTVVLRRLSALETPPTSSSPPRPSCNTQSPGQDVEHTLKQDTHTFEKERREGQVTHDSLASDDLFTRFKLDQLNACSITSTFLNLPCWTDSESNHHQGVDLAEFLTDGKGDGRFPAQTNHFHLRQT